MNITPWIFYALLSAFFAALTAIFAKAGLKNIDSDLATAIRTAVILVITWGIVFFKGTNSQAYTISKNNWLFLVLSAIATGLSWLFYFRALQEGRAAEVSAIDKGSLLFTALLAFIFLKEPMTPKVLLGIGLIFTGMLVMIWK
ncbi:MAG: EamA family transporter [Bacteroidetes bacterium]|nr:EamA family transporter [Bacteroidota bacterium]